MLHIPAPLLGSQSVRHKIPPNRCGYYFFDKYSVIHSCITAATVTPCSAAYIFKNCLSSTVTDRFNVVLFSDPRIFLIPFSVSDIDNTSCHNISNCVNTQFILSFFSYPVNSLFSFFSISPDIPHHLYIARLSRFPKQRKFSLLYYIFSSNATVSTCMVWGNMSTGCTFRIL